MFAAKNHNSKDTLPVIKKLNKAIILLTEAIKKENSLLQSGKFADLQKICDEKIERLKEFNEIERELELIARTTQIDKNASEIEQIKVLLTELDGVNSTNDILIRANIEANAKIIEFYKDAQKNKMVQKYGYDNQGKLALSRNFDKVIPYTGLNDKI